MNDNNKNKNYSNCLDNLCNKELKDTMNKENLIFLIKIYKKIDKIKTKEDFNKVLKIFEKDVTNKYQFDYIKCSLFDYLFRNLEIITNDEIKNDTIKLINDISKNKDNDETIIKLAFHLLYIIRMHINFYLKKNR